MACALAAPPKKAFDAYRSAVGTCGGSAAELDRLALLATVGEAVAARLDDGALEHASRSLAHDAVWWRFLKRRGVAFDHARLCLQASATTVDVRDILRRSASHATELLPAVLDAPDPDDLMKLQEEGDCRRPVSCSLIRQVLEFCEQFGVEDDVAGAAIATRVLARGVSGDGESLSDAARDALDLVRDPERRIRVLRAALATADATAYDRLDLILRMLVEEKEEDEPRVALSPVDENTSNQVAKVSDAEKRRAALLRACVIDAQSAARAAGGSVEARDDRAFAAPTEATLKKWIRCAAWLRISPGRRGDASRRGGRPRFRCKEAALPRARRAAPGDVSSAPLGAVGAVSGAHLAGRRQPAEGRRVDRVCGFGGRGRRAPAPVEGGGRLLPEARQVPERAVGLQASRCPGRRLRRAIAGGTYGSGRPRPPQGGARGGEVRVALGRPGEHARSRRRARRSY